MPPVAALYQSMVFPGSATTVSAGMGSPSQMEGLLGIVGGFTGEQLQFGALMACWNWQPVEVILLKTVTFVPAGIPVMVKFPLLPETVPADAVTLLPLVVTATLYVSKSEAHNTEVMDRVGSGLMVMTKLTGVPVHPPRLGVMVMVAVVTLLTLPAVKFRSPVPLAPRPMAVLLFVQEKVAPGVPENATATGLPEQASVGGGWLTIGEPTTVMSKLWLCPGQPFALGVTVTVPVPTLVAVKLILPEPLAPSPILVLLFVQAKVGLLVPVKLTTTISPEHTGTLGGSTTVGAGLMVMVKVTGAPMQLPTAGVTVMVAVCCVPTPAAIKFRLPLPLAPRPMVVLLLVQLNVAPALPEKLTLTVVPAQASTLLGWLTVGAGVTVMVKFCAMPGQPFSLGVTITVPVVGMVTVAALKLMSPVPLAPRPMLVLVFVQLNVGLTVPSKITLTGSPEQTVWLGGSITVGVGLMVMVNDTGLPGQPLMIGVTVILAISWVETPVDVKFRLPMPLAPRPMAVLSFDQEKMAPDDPENVAVTGAPPQTEILAGWLTVGNGLTVMVKLWLGPGHPLALGVTVMLPVVGLVTLAAVKEISPEPLGPRPMDVLEFVQLKFGFPVPLKITSTGWPAHTLWLGGSITVGDGLTVMVNITGGPGQPFRMGITVMLATS